MKFRTQDGTTFEVSNLARVIVNHVHYETEPGREIPKGPRKGWRQPRLTGKKHRVGPTEIWERLTAIPRWLKFKHEGNIEDVRPPLSEAISGASPKEMQAMIQKAMKQPNMRVWFSGTYCNIEIIDNFETVQQIREISRPKKQPFPRHSIGARLGSMDLSDFIAPVFQVAPPPGSFPGIVVITRKPRKK